MSKIAFDLAPLAAFSLILTLVNYRIDGIKLVAQGATNGWKSFLSFGPALVLIFFLLGQAQVLVAKYSGTVKIWMGGSKGLIGCYFAGFFAPGGIGALPIVREMWNEGYDKRALIMFLVSAQLLNLQTTMWQASMVGWHIMSVRYGIGLALAALVLIVLLFLL